MLNTFSIMNSVNLLVGVLIIFCSYYCCASSRNITCSVNPGLDDLPNDQNVNVVHIVARGVQDDIHYVWSTYELPSIIVARTTKNTTLSINSTKLKHFEKDAIAFVGDNPVESLGLTFSKLWKLHYDKDSSGIFDKHSVEEIDMESLRWTYVNETLKCSESFASAVLASKNADISFSENGTLEFQFSVSADQVLSDETPHLVFTGNSTMLKIILHNLFSNTSKIRYGFEISVFSNFFDDCNKDQWEKVTSRFLNDEFCPGVFEDVELRPPCSNQNKKSSFISWRPVAYTGEKPLVANSSDVTMMTDPLSIHDFSVHSIAELYFAEKVNSSSFNVTFGTEGDGFYEKTKYTAWSLMLGTGAMVEIPLSSSVIIFVAVGLGLISLFIISGGVFILIHRCKEKDDDLLLN